MSELKLEVGKKYNIQFRISILENVIASEFVKEFNGGIVLFDYNGNPVLANKEFDIISEYTEPKKLEGWVLIYDRDDIDGVFASNPYNEDGKNKEIEVNKKRARPCNYLACIPLSQFNEGYGL